jgi:hypothetical protein
MVELSKPFKEHQSIRLLWLSLKTTKPFTSIVVLLSVNIKRFHLLLPNGLSTEFDLSTSIDKCPSRVQNQGIGEAFARLHQRSGDH